MLSKTANFIEKAKIIHGDKYDYSQTEYTHVMKNVKIICSIHGVFEISANKHLNGRGCNICGRKRIYEAKQSSTVEFINKAKQVHIDYDYSLVEYKKSNVKVKILCKLHGEFECSPNNHLRGKGCPICKLSRGEVKIKQWLDTNNIIHYPQHRFNNCKNKRPLPFDFYLPVHNICIEYDGKQHYNVEAWSSDNEKNIERLKLLQHNDKIKDEYCLISNIRLIRIPYFNYQSIENILTNSIS